MYDISSDSVSRPRYSGHDPRLGNNAQRGRQALPSRLAATYLELVVAVRQHGEVGRAVVDGLVNDVDDSLRSRREDARVFIQPVQPLAST